MYLPKVPYKERFRSKKEAKTTVWYKFEIIIIIIILGERILVREYSQPIIIITFSRFAREMKRSWQSSERDLRSL